TSYSGSITVNSDATSGVNTISCSGSGTASPTKIINLSGNLNFGSVTVAQSANATLTISNTGNTALTVSSINCPPGFSGNWSGSISAGGSQNVTITFSPSSVTSYSGSITVNSDATSGVNIISCSGTGISNLYINVNNLNGDVNVCNSDGIFVASKNISWSSNITGGTVDIILLHNEIFEFNIATAQSNNGNYLWGNISLANLNNLPTTDNTYKIKITHSNGTFGVCSYNFTIQKVNCSPGDLCSKLAIRFPQNNASGMPQSIKLDWEDCHVSNPSYELNVTDINNNTVFTSNSLINSYYEFSVGTFQYNLTYEWKVRALQNQIPVTEWSDIYTFTIKPVSPSSPNYGAALGHLNDAVIYKNYNDYSGYWQCVEYVKRYQNVVYGLYMPSIGNADAYFWSSQLGFARFINTNSSMPQVSDIVCLSGGTSGHVAIVKEVVFSNDGNNSNDFVYISQQNVGSNINNHLNQQVSLSYSSNKYTISNFAGKTVQGWRRAMPTIITPKNGQIYSTQLLVDWVEHPNAINYKVFASKQNPSTGCYEP
ncbi:MAG: choice-of-anchor D domain-containing protein, partial [Bacteroidia bacterium]